MAPYSIFSDCFASMGAAALYKATGEEKHKQEAESAMNNYIARMDNPKGKWEKSLDGRAKRLNIAHYMILANLGHVINNCLNIKKYSKEIEEASETVLEKFWNSELNMLFENINIDGTFDLDSCDGRHANPGHGLESMWFILQHAEKGGNKIMQQKACDIILHLLDFGWDKEFGGIYYFMDVLNKPHIELQADMKLWWVHNEAIIAVLYAYKLTKDERFLKWFHKLDDWTWNHFPDKKYGEWFGYLNREGKPTHSLKGGKWKTFFHLPRFLLTSIKLMKQM
jgi:N-acylglucosamine 2-epimerase